MLLSMTGHGEAQVELGECTATAQVRAVNGRYLKVILRGYDFTPSAEARIEALARGAVRRGNVTLNVRVSRSSGTARFAIQTELLREYVRQLADSDLDFDPQSTLGALLQLPGVVESATESAAGQAEEVKAIEQAVAAAFDSLTRMRAEEGGVMAEDLAAKSARIRTALEAIEAKSPDVVIGYRDRLKDRMSALLAENNIVVSETDFLKEVGLFADRCDISEEVVRLGSHLDQFAAVLDSPESEGRKLEFIIQEMLRETNTIGSKANDSTIANLVVEIKNNIERMREMVQNVE